MDEPGYSPLFYVMLIIGIIGVVERHAAGIHQEMQHG